MPAVRAKRQRDMRFHAALFLVAVALGLLLEAAGPRWVQAIFRNVNLDSFANASAVVTALLAAVVTHEAGHLLMAWVCGFEILGGKLGPLRIERLHGTRKISFSSSGLFSCAISAVPRDDAGWRKKMLWVVAGGPAANFVVAMLLITGFGLTQLNTDPGKVFSVAPGSPAAAAGLKAGDSIHSVDGIPFKSPGLVGQIEGRAPGAPLTLSGVHADGQPFAYSVTPRCDAQGKSCLIGVGIHRRERLNIEHTYRLSA